MVKIPSTMPHEIEEPATVEAMKPLPKAARKMKARYTASMTTDIVQPKPVRSFTRV